MKATSPKYYWDTSIFLAWLMNEKRAPGEMEGLAEVAALFDRREAVLVTSVLAKTEVLESSLDATGRALFDDIFKRSNIVLCDVTEPISDLAREIRDHGKLSGRNIKTPDATHLATAIIYRVDAMHTFDGRLLSLNGAGTGRQLVVCKPRGVQRELFL
jgi:predicted nucleic acid-binding protein